MLFMGVYEPLHESHYELSSNSFCYLWISVDMKTFNNYLTCEANISLIQNPANVSNAAEEWSAALEATGGHQPQMRAVSKRSSTEM